MTERSGMIADTFFLDRTAPAGEPATDGYTSAPTVAISPDAKPVIADVERRAILTRDQALAKEILATAAQQRSGGWIAGPTPRLELGERDARLIALDLAIRHSTVGESNSAIAARAEAFLAFLTSGAVRLHP